MAKKQLFVQIRFEHYKKIIRWTVASFFVRYEFVQTFLAKKFERKMDQILF